MIKDTFGSKVQLTSFEVKCQSISVKNFGVKCQSIGVKMHLYDIGVKVESHLVKLQSEMCENQPSHISFDDLKCKKTASLLLKFFIHVIKFFSNHDC